MASRKVEIRVSVDDLDAGKRLDALAAKLDKLTKKVWNIRVKLDDGGAGAKLDKMAERLDKISTKTYTPKIKTDGITKADAQLDKFNAKLDRIGHRRVTATVSVRTDNNTISRDLGKLLGGGGGGGGIIRDLESGGAAAGGGGNAAGGILSTIGGANNSYLGGLIAALVAWASLIAPAIIPLGLGGAVGGGAAGGALAIGSSAHQKILQLQQSLSMIVGNTKTDKARRAVIEQQIAAVRKGRGPELQLFGGVRQLGHTALGVFNEALTSTGRGFSGGPGGHPGTSFLTGLMAILKQLGPFLKQIGPLLGQLFRASLPSIEAFMKIMLQFAKAVMPAVLQVLKQLQPQLPIIVRGFLYLSEGIAGFIKNLGPGIKDGAIIFKTSMMVVGATLRLIGSAATGFAILLVRTIEVVKTVAPRVALGFKEMFHLIASLFDTWRHGWAHMWDVVYHDTIGAVIRIDKDVVDWFQRLSGSVDNIETGFYNTIRHWWDNVWSFTVGSVRKGVSDVTGWFHRLPGNIMGALKGLGSGLMSVGKTAMSDFWKGLRTIGSDIMSWVKNFFTSIPHDIMSWLHMSPPHPGSAFYDLGANFMHHLSAGMEARANKIGFGAIAGGLGKNLGGSVTAWITAAMRGAGAPMSWLPALSRLVMLESGGNPRAVNPVSVMGQHATGLWQMLASTFAAYGGRGGLMGMFNPVIEGIAAIRYIMSRYGSPFNIPGLFGGGYRGYFHGGIIDEPIFGMGLRTGTSYSFGEHGIRERVTPLGYGGGGGGNIYITVKGDTNPNAAAFRIWQLLRQYRTTHGNIPLKLG